MNPVTIIGRGPSWKECPFNTDELWGTATCLLTGGLVDKNYTKVFAFDNDTDDKLRRAVEVAKMRNIPVVSSYEHFATELFPTYELVKKFKSSFFLNSISRMIAYAVYLECPKLYINGIDQGPGWDMQQSKPHVTFWLGFALAKGVDLRLGRGSLTWAYRVGEAPAGIAYQEEEISLAVGV